MKSIPFLFLSLLTMQAYAESLLSTLNSHQNSLQTTANSSSGVFGATSPTGGKPDVTPSVTSTSSNSVRCESQDQTSIPLAYITSLIQEKDGKLQFTYDGGNRLDIKSPNMISNCNSMIEWTLKQPDIKGQRSYAIEAKIRKGDRCNDVTNECVYLVDKVEDGEFKQKDEVALKPTLKGFEECLRKTGVVANGKVVTGAIQNGSINESFEGLKSSAPLLFLSTGPQSAQVGPKYAKQFEYQYGCENYESAHPEVKMLLSSADAEKQRLDAEAVKLKNCKVEDYGKLAEFIAKYEGYQSELGEVRDRLILEAVKKSIAAIEKGNPKAEDLKVIEDFNQYIVQPKIEYARALYEELADLEGDARKVKEEEYVKLLAQISALGRKPYFESSHVMKLMALGEFDKAEELNKGRLVIVHNSRLGAMEQNVRQTPGLINQKIKADEEAFHNTVETAKTEYRYKTGEESGNANTYTQAANAIRNRMANRNKETIEYLQQLQQRAQTYCMHPVRLNPNKCLQETYTASQNTQIWWNERNQADTEELKSMEELSRKWNELEAQGRRYIAVQRGEEVPVESTKPEAEKRPEMPKLEEPQQQGPYTFQWNNGMQPQQQQFQQQQFQQQQFQQNPYINYQSPYAYYQGQQSYMGQQAYQPQPQFGAFGQAGYSFNWNGGQQPQYSYPPQAMPYYQQQYGALNSNYSFFGRR